MSNTITAVILPDTHIPFHDFEALRAIRAFLKDTKPDYLIQLGDWLDLETLSRFTKHDARRLSEGDVYEESKMGREIWADLAQFARKTVMLEGNHDARGTYFVKENPSLRTLLDPKVLLGFDKDVPETYSGLGTQFVRADSEGQVFRLEWQDDKITTRVYNPDDRVSNQGVALIHGWYFNKYHAKQTAERWGHGPIFYGHTHDTQMMTIERYGPDAPCAGSLGTLCKYELDYLKGRPTRWQKAFGVLRLNPQRAGHFSISVPRIVDGSFIAPNGKVYDGQWRSKMKFSHSSRSRG